MAKLDVQGYGLPWFTEAQWHRYKSEMPDGHTFHDTYAEFVAKVEKGERDLRQQGHATIRVPINVDEFRAWCAQAGCEINAHARAQFAGLAAAKTDHDRRGG